MLLCLLECYGRLEAIVLGRVEVADAVSELVGRLRLSRQLQDGKQHGHRRKKARVKTPHHVGEQRTL